jgi:hypothetical protein
MDNTVNLCSFYFNKFIGKLTAFLQFQEFTCREEDSGSQRQGRSSSEGIETRKGSLSIKDIETHKGSTTVHKDPCCDRAVRSNARRPWSNAGSEDAEGPAGSETAEDSEDDTEKTTGKTVGDIGSERRGDGRGR